MIPTMGYTVEKKRGRHLLVVFPVPSRMCLCTRACAIVVCPPQEVPITPYLIHPAQAALNTPLLSVRGQVLKYRGGKAAKTNNILLLTVIGPPFMYDASTTYAMYTVP